jgi:hypothetical protein
METLSWEKLERHIGTGKPILLPMGGTRAVLIGFDPSGARLFLRMPLDNDAQVPASPYAELRVEARTDGRDTVLEIYTASSHLFKEFHRLAGLRTEEFERGGQTAVGALSAVVKRWRELTTKRGLLSAEEQLGLVGELAVLEGLSRRHGPSVVSSWTGRMPSFPERHDFRVGQVDLEVKATRMSRRQHIIHGLRQLKPSSGYRLFLISLRFESAGMGNGASLCDRVRIVRKTLSGNRAAREEFETKLRAADYSDLDEAHYQERLILADPPVIIAVDEKCPRLIPETVRDAIGLERANRIGDDVTYRIDVEGLGVVLAASMEAKALGLLSVE